MGNFAGALLPPSNLPAFALSPLPQDPCFCGFFRAEEGPQHPGLHCPSQAQRPAVSGHLEVKACREWRRDCSEGREVSWEGLV